MAPRVRSLLATMLALAVLAFGELCALGPAAPAGAAPVESAAPAAHATCDGGCGAPAPADEPGAAACPSGAVLCCSSWGPPSARLSMTPPAGVGFTAEPAIESAPAAEPERGAGRAAFERVRPPGDHPRLATALSRRGPPARI